MIHWNMCGQNLPVFLLFKSWKMTTVTWNLNFRHILIYIWSHIHPNVHFDSLNGVRTPYYLSCSFCGFWSIKALIDFHNGLDKSSYPGSIVCHFLFWTFFCKCYIWMRREKLNVLYFLDEIVTVYRVFSWCFTQWCLFDL